MINRLAARFPDLKGAPHALTGRIVDLLPLVKAHYYHPDTHGSFSIKTVLPTVAPHHVASRLNSNSSHTAPSTPWRWWNWPGVSPGRIVAGATWTRSERII